MHINLGPVPSTIDDTDDLSVEDVAVVIDLGALELGFTTEGDARTCSLP